MGNTAKSAQVWVIELPGIGVIEGTHANTRHRCITTFITWAARESRAAGGNSPSWRDLYRSGYRCTHARLVLEE